MRSHLHLLSIISILAVSQRTTDQANIVGETAVGSANEVGQKTVEGLENVAASAGLNQVRSPPALDVALSPKSNSIKFS